MFPNSLELKNTSQGKDRFLVDPLDPYPNLLYKKRKLAKQRVAEAAENITTSSALASSSIVSSEQTLTVFLKVAGEIAWKRCRFLPKPRSTDLLQTAESS